MPEHPPDALDKHILSRLLLALALARLLLHEPLRDGLDDLLHAPPLFLAVLLADGPVFVRCVGMCAQ